MKLNNRGMTLVEMIVAFAILGLVSTSIFSMMSVGTKTYTKLTNTVKVQYDAQLASAKIEKQLLNCSDGIYWTRESNQYKIVMVEGRTAHAYCLNENTKTLYYGTATLENSRPTRLEMHLLAEHVNSIEIVTDEAIEENDPVKYVQLKMVLERNDKTYTIDKTISLRNTPQFKEYRLHFDF